METKTARSETVMWVRASRLTRTLAEELTDARRMFQLGEQTASGALLGDALATLEILQAQIVKIRREGGVT